jgi:hypothetical protein
MTDSLSRRTFAVAAAAATANAVLTSTVAEGAEPAKAEPPKETTPKSEGPVVSGAAGGPTEAPFVRDYEAPKFKPAWKRSQLNRLLVQDFIVFAHSDLEMTKKLLEKEPGLVVAAMNWGADDWETGLGGASHMGRRDIATYLIENKARVDIFSAAMLGLVDVVKSFLAFQPKLIDAKGPHGFTLHFHAQVGGKESENVLDYLQSVKKIELKPIPFLKKDPQKKAEGKPE